MNLFDFLKRNKQEQNIEFAPLQAPQQNGANNQEPFIKPIFLNADGTASETLPVQQNVTPIKQRNKWGSFLSDALLGKQAQATDNIDENAMNVTVSNNPRTGGILRDFASGYDENVNTPASLDNLGQHKDKGFAFRLGEGVGSLARFARSPLGRSVIVGGIVGATGGNPLQMLAYGGQTGALNQQYRNNDKIYRNDLLQNAKQQLMNSPEYNQLSDAEKAQIMTDLQNDPAFTGLTDDNKKQEMIDEAIRAYLGNRQNSQLKELEDNINGLRGYITNDTYNNLMKSQQIRDNYAYRNMMLDNQMKQNEIMNQLRQDQFKAQQDQNAFNNWYKKQSLANDQQRLASDNAYKNATLGLGYAKLNNDINKQQTKAQKDFMKANKGNIDVLNQISNIRSLIKQNPGAVGLAKGNTPGFIVNRLDSKGVETRTAIDDLRTFIRHELTGAQFSPAEAREYEKFLPTTKDNPQIINAKLDALEKKFNAKIYGQNTNNQQQTVGKYKVRVK